MASFNDFKILNKKCEKYYRYLQDQTRSKADLNEVEKRRLGFYIYILENISTENDIDFLIDSVIDTEFNCFINQDRHDDGGIDAVLIDDEKNLIRLFNFKFREKFSPGSKQHLNDSFISTKYINAIANENYKGLSGKPLTKAKEIVKRLNSNDEWSLELYQVSNETNETEVIDNHIENLMNNYDLKVIPIGLPSIADMMSIRPKPVSACIILDKEAVMSFSEDYIETEKSYIARISGSEIVRITSNSEVLRNDNNIEDIQPLSNLDIEYGVLFDNVRGFILKSKYNPNILSSLKKSPNKFFKYNNGITIVARGVEARRINANKRVRLDITDFQVVNGGQTVRTLHEFNRQDTENISKYLSETEVLVRIFKSDSDSDEIHKIAEYTNSQNSIKASDLKSLSAEQIEIERYLEEHDIIYSRKSGDTGKGEKNYKHKITMERFGQILTAVRGNPERSTNSIQNIFDKYYENLFLNNFDISICPSLINEYYEVIEKYKISKYKGVQLKYFYILYSNRLELNLDIDAAITELESFLREFSTEKEKSDVMKLGMTRFRDEFTALLRKKY